MAGKPLPRFIVLKSRRNDKYLIHLQDDQDYLQFSGTDFANLHVKYEVVSSKKVDGLVHLKCCYNQMYWVCRPNQWRITADAREVEDDQTKRSCTLFKPVFFGTSNNIIGFCHVNINKNVIFSDQTPFYMTVGTPSSKEGDYLEFSNWEKLPILPQYIALKGDGGNYLSAYVAPQLHDKISNPVTNVLRWINPAYRVVDEIIQATDDKNVYLRLNCKDKGAQTVGNEVFTTPDGKIRLKSNHTGKFWKASPNWIRPDSEDESNNDPYTLFEVSKISQNQIALKNVGNTKFCESLSVDGKEDCLNANSTTVSNTAKFMVEELVEKRNIFNVRFHKKAARKYEMEIMSDVRSTDVNNTGAAIQSTIEFEYTKEESRTWTTSNELKQTAEVKITVGSADVVGGDIKYAREVTETITDGKTLNIEEKKKYSRTVTVLPYSKVVATFRVTHALCDIPYSYSQTETLTDGTSGDTQHRDDGLYTSVRTEVEFNPKQEKII